MTQVSQPRGLGIGDHALNPFFFGGRESLGEPQFGNYGDWLIGRP